MYIYGHYNYSCHKVTTILNENRKFSYHRGTAVCHISWNLGVFSHPKTNTWYGVHVYKISRLSNSRCLWNGWVFKWWWLGSVFDKVHTTSYLPFTETMHLFCTIFRV